MQPVTKVTTVTKARRTLGAFCACVTSVTFVTFVTSISAAAEKPFAAPQTVEHVSPASAGSLLQVTFSLLLVLGAVFAAAWVVRRLKGFGRFGSSVIHVVADAAVGPKERAVLIQVGEQQLLLGVTQGQVNLLHVLPQPVSTAQPPAVAGAAQEINRPDFAAILRRSLGLK
ncbi:flagellar biosynthetic protein FliO [Povalibacter sp.]|uniref:flagellar biosynthetic protein FliO n=1 Tax=Povalibacter sp. TaxID=1962978 RepID=UPI002F3F52E2